MIKFVSDKNFSFKFLFYIWFPNHVWLRFSEKEIPYVQQEIAIDLLLQGGVLIIGLGLTDGIQISVIKNSRKTLYTIDGNCLDSKLLQL